MSTAPPGPTAADLTGDELALANEIDAARAARRTISGKRGLLDLEAGYRIQQARIGDRSVVGRKIGMVSPAKLAQFGYSEPVHGPVFDGMVLANDDVDLDAFLQPRVEPELAFVLAADLEAGAGTQAAAQAAQGLFLAVDILDTVWEGYGFEPPEAVADGVNGGGFVLGEHLLPLDVAGDLRMTLDGELLGEGPVADLGHPIERLAWLADAVGGLHAGDAVFLGAPAANVPARPGILELRGPEGALLVTTL